jgi:hypothetical protein
MDWSTLWAILLPTHLVTLILFKGRTACADDNVSSGFVVLSRKKITRSQFIKTVTQVTSFSSIGHNGGVA